MTSDALTIRTMTRDEVAAIAIEWAAREGWNPGLDDAAAFHAADPAGFLLGELNGEPAACISAVAYGDSFGFLGFYIVRPDLRGRGYGLRLWQAALDRLQGRTLGLDGVVAQQASYACSGFSLAWRNVRYQLTKAALTITSGTKGRGHGGSILPAAMLSFADLAAFDRRFFPAGREAFLKHWLNLPQGIAIAALDDDDALVGYGVIRACRSGFKVGPLFADSPAVAKSLFGVLAGQAGAGPVFLDAPETNPTAISLARLYGMEKVFETARMYKGEAPPLPIDNIYGMTSFELG
jgi:ribosomal protein S18 acetylase RimI-like enzyme